MNKLYSPKEGLCAQKLVGSFQKDWTISKFLNYFHINSEIHLGSFAS